MLLGYRQRLASDTRFFANAARYPSRAQACVCVCVAGGSEGVRHAFPRYFRVQTLLPVPRPGIALLPPHARATAAAPRSSGGAAGGEGGGGGNVGVGVAEWVGKGEAESMIVQLRPRWEEDSAPELQWQAQYPSC